MNTQNDLTEREVGNDEKYERIARELEEVINQQETWLTRLRRWIAIEFVAYQWRRAAGEESKAWKLVRQFIYLIFSILIIPIAVLFWNVHPILGLLLLIFFVWLIKNKWMTGYYFGE